MYTFKEMYLISAYSCSYRQISLVFLPLKINGKKSSSTTTLYVVHRTHLRLNKVLVSKSLYSYNSLGAQSILNPDKINMMLDRKPGDLEGIVLPTHGGKRFEPVKLTKCYVWFVGIANSLFGCLHLVWMLDTFLKLENQDTLIYTTVTFTLHYFNMLCMGQPLKAVWTVICSGNLP